MGHLDDMLQVIQQKRASESRRQFYYIPEVWNTLEYNEYTVDYSRKKEICVNPYDYYSYYISYILKVKAENKYKIKKAESIIHKVMYCLQTRTFSAWNHISDEIECGTFLKTILMLPYLKKMNIDIIYLLPIFKIGSEYKKGNAGSAYAIKNFYKLDENLHDELLGEYSEIVLNKEFGAFIEACHIMGIQVVVDFVFRTMSRDSELLLKNPNWFYWIKAKFCNLKPFEVETLEELTYVSEEIISKLYTAEGLKEYLNMFTYSPDKINPEKWQKFLEEKGKQQENILKEIEKKFEVTTAPAYSDVINDFQETWSDVTYLKLFFDVHTSAKNYIAEEQPPYILQDIAKASIFSGEQPNLELWEYIINVIPYYQKEFCIDGARIDMGHALPQMLVEEIIKASRKIDNNFILWSEEFRIENAEKVKKQGFDFITGELYKEVREHRKLGFWKVLLNNVLWKSTLPMIAALETPDTLRCSSIYETGQTVEKLLSMIFFAPNCVQMIICGMEIGEKQPMNCGLDKVDDIHSILEQDDPMNGLLPFFDKYRLHWNEEKEISYRNLITSLTTIRNKVKPLLSMDLFSDISEPENDLTIWKYSNNSAFYILSYDGEEKYYEVDLKKKSEFFSKELIAIKLNEEQNLEMEKVGEYVHILKSHVIYLWYTSE